MHASTDIETLSQEIYNESAFVDRILEASGRVIVGQHYMISRLLLGLLADGHVLLEGLPGLAKTLAIKL
jgi:MoxR-like ATPase